MKIVHMILPMVLGLAASAPSMADNGDRIGDVIGGAIQGALGGMDGRRGNERDRQIALERQARIDDALDLAQQDLDNAKRANANFRSRELRDHLNLVKREADKALSYLR